MPAGASGAAGGSAQPAAETHDHLLPRLAGGQADAIEHDRAPASIVEEHTASPD